MESVCPGALVLGVADDALADAVAALVALRPLAAVQPTVACLDAETMSLAILPLALERTTTEILILMLLILFDLGSIRAASAI